MTDGRKSRAPREELVKNERRRRMDSKVGGKLAIPQSIKDKHPDMQFRWALDGSQRMQELTKDDDYDVVPEHKTISAGKVGDDRGKNHILLMKKKSYWLEDQANMMKRIDDIEDSQINDKPDVNQAIGQGADMYAEGRT